LEQSCASGQTHVAVWLIAPGPQANAIQCGGAVVLSQVVLSISGATTRMLRASDVVLLVECHRSRKMEAKQRIDG
jgi:hypothetical protein